MKQTLFVMLAAGIFSAPTTVTAATNPGKTAAAVDKECAGAGAGGGGGAGLRGAAMGMRSGFAKQAGRCAAAKIACAKKAKAAGKKLSKAKSAKAKGTAKDVASAADKCKGGDDKSPASNAQGSQNSGNQASKGGGGSPSMPPMSPQSNDQQQPQQQQAQQPTPQSVASKDPTPKPPTPWDRKTGPASFSPASVKPGGSSAMAGSSDHVGSVDGSNNPNSGVKVASIPNGSGGMPGSASSGSSLGGMAPASLVKNPNAADIMRGLTSYAASSTGSSMDSGGGGGGFSGYGTPRGPASEEPPIKLADLIPKKAAVGKDSLHAVVGGIVKNIEIQSSTVNLFNRISATMHRRCGEGRLRDCY
jgi:hypothetical protein